MFKRVQNAEWTARRCRHPEHEAPGMVSLPPGAYEHECPGCGHKSHVVVRSPEMTHRPFAKISGRPL